MELLTLIGTVFSFWFILGSITFTIFLIYFVEHEYIIRSSITIAVYIVFLQFLIKIDIIGSVTNNPTKSLIILLIYLVIGFLWSIIKWVIFVNKKAIKYKEKRYEFLKDPKILEILKHKNAIGLNYKSTTNSNNAIETIDDITLETPIPDELMEEWRRHGYSLYSKIPVVHEEKNKISNWILYWPPSLIWSLLNDFLKNLANIIVVRVKFVYEWFTKRAYNGIEQID